MLILSSIILILDIIWAIEHTRRIPAINIFIGVWMLHVFISKKVKVAAKT